MTTAAPAKTGLDALLTPEKSILILIDHQPYQFANLHSHDPALIQNNVVALAKAAKAFNVPTILTTVLEQRGYKPIPILQPPTFGASRIARRDIGRARSLG